MLVSKEGRISLDDFLSALERGPFALEEARELHRVASELPGEPDAVHRLWLWRRAAEE